MKKVISLILIMMIFAMNLEISQTKAFGGAKKEFLAQITYGKNEMVKIKLKGRDEQYQTTSLTANNITVRLDGNVVNPTTKTVMSTTNVNGGVDALICLSGFPSTGKLTLTLAAGTLTDAAGNRNTETTINTTSNIGDIYIGVADANATSADILQGKTAYKGTTILTGTMPYRGLVQWAGGIGSGSDNGTEYIAANQIPQGYYNSEGNWWGPEIRMKRTDVLNFLGNRGAQTNRVSVGEAGGTYYIRIPQGAYFTNAGPGYPEITVSAADLGITADKIVAGQSIGGVAGTASSSASCPTMFDCQHVSGGEYTVIGSVGVPTGSTNIKLQFCTAANGNYNSRILDVYGANDFTGDSVGWYRNEGQTFPGSVLLASVKEGTHTINVSGKKVVYFKYRNTGDAYSTGEIRILGFE